MDYRWDENEASALTDDLERMVYLSRRVGGDPLLTQPGGGNTSIKWAERDSSGRETPVLRVKASGTDLAAMERKGFTGLRLEGLRVLRDRDTMTDGEMLELLHACRLDGLEPPPSLETPLHALLPYRCIAHVHDLATLALTDTSRRDALVREALGEEAAYVGYVRPGFPLARTVRALGGLGKARGLVMGKHGLVAWGGTPRECYDNLHRLVSLAEAFLQKARTGRPPFEKRRHPEAEAGARRARAIELLPLLRAALSKERKVILRHDGSDEAAAFASSQRAKDIYRRGMATPEHIFRCGRLPLYVDAPLGQLPPPEAAGAVLEAIDRFEADYRASFARHARNVEMHDPRPRVVLLPGLGIATSGKSRRDAEIAWLCYRHVTRVMERAEVVDQFRFIEEASSFELEYWPWERIRPPAPEGALSRRVALVPGAAAGIGRAAAGSLAGAGACVAPCDAGGNAAEEAVLDCGGIDILVCNSADESAAVAAAVRAMKAQGSGVIIFHASEAAAKADLARRTQDLARNLSPRGIRVHGLNAAPADAARRDRAAAEAALSLATDVPPHVSGSVVTVGSPPAGSQGA